MKPFIYYNPVKIIFGTDSFLNFGKNAENLGKHALIVIGQSSAKRNGLLEKTRTQLEQSGISSDILSGIKPNPIIEKVYEGINFARLKKADFIIALGGGSVIDTAKAIAAGFFYENDVWDFFSMKAEVKKALPLCVILTVSATGSEMNSIAVIQNDNLRYKIRMQSPHIFPKFTILDPILTKSVGKEYTAYASVDIISHVIEGYFTQDDCDTPIQDGFTESIVKTVIDNTYILMNDLLNIEGRANIMWAASLALSGIPSAGIGNYRFENHLIEHSISAYHDIPHGAGLSIVIPAWMKVNEKKLSNRFAKFGRNVFGIDGEKSAERTICSLEKFFNDIGSPTRLSFYGIKDIDPLIDNIMECAPSRNLHLERNYVESILKQSL